MTQTLSAPSGTGIDIEQTGTAAALHIAGEVTDTSHRQLVESLDWLVVSGCTRVDVHFGSTGHLDAAWLETLRNAQLRLWALSGQLMVTAEDPQVRFTLSLTGLAA